MKDLIIRNETADDYAAVERMTRDAFWNLYIPGGQEHYLAHILRGHEDFIPELDLVAELNGQIVGNVMYTRCTLVNEDKKERSVLTFGPLCVHPDHQRKGIGKALLEHSFARAVEMGFDAIVIFGVPGNYVSRGFKCCQKFNICLDGDVFPTAMMVKELIPGVFDGSRWYYHGSSAYEFDDADVLEFDKQFPAKEEKYQPSQDEFYIYSHSTVTADS